MIQKRIMSAVLIFALTATAAIPMISNAMELEADYEKTEKEPDPYKEDYFHVLSKEELLPFSFENQEVQSSMGNLIDRTEDLKSNYSTDEAVSIIKELRNNVKKITKNDYEKEHALIHDEQNYENGEFYKYKVSPTVWIIKNVLHCFSIKDMNNFDAFQEIMDFIYDMAITEMKNECKSDRVMQIIANLNEISDRFPEEFSEYLAFVRNLAIKDSLSYENGRLPEDKTPSDAFGDFLENQMKQEIEREEEFHNGELAEVEKTGDVETIEENYFDAANNIQLSDQNTVISYDSSSMAAYNKRMNEIESQGFAEIKDYSVKTIYYTFDKTVDQPVWESTNIDLNEDGEVEYDKFIAALKSISKKSKDFSFMEDNDMAMFIAEGKPLVLNRVKKVSSEDMDTLFDVFEKLGIKVALKQDEMDEGKESLSDKLEAGEMNAISVNGSKLILTKEPILTKNILQLPVLQVAESLGYQVSINGNTVTLTYEEKAKTTALDENMEETSIEQRNKVEIILSVDNNHYTINGQKNSFKTPVTEKDGTIYAEFDRLASKIGYSYSYNADTGVIEFNK